MNPLINRTAFLHRLISLFVQLMFAYSGHSSDKPKTSCAGTPG